MLGYNAEGIDADGGGHAEFSWKDERGEEFKVDIGCKLVRVDEEGMGSIVPILIP